MHSLSFLWPLVFLAPAINSRTILPRDGAGTAEQELQYESKPSSSTLFNNGVPKYRDVAQGTNGDCWLDAASAALAYADPNHLKFIMYDLFDSKGLVTVTLWDGTTPYVQNITKPTLMDYHASQSIAVAIDDEAVWPAVMELAFKGLAKQFPSLMIAPTLNGGTIASSLEAMYGLPSTSVTYYMIGDASDDELWALWDQAPTKPTTSSSGDPTKKVMMADGLPGNHAYTAMHGDRSTGVVTLRNPWGKVSQNSIGFSNNGGKGVTGLGDGVFSISYSDWKLYFLDIAGIK